VTAQTGTAARIFRNALVERCTALWASETPFVRVTRGLPAFEVADDNVSIGSVTFNQEPANFGTNRSREETLTCEVLFFSYRGGSDEMEDVVEDRVYKLFTDLAQYVRVTDTTLGGVVRQCFATAGQSDAATDPAVMATGRLHVLTATFTAQARITS
jgi:hypothetical protein